MSLEMKGLAWLIGWLYSFLFKHITNKVTNDTHVQKFLKLRHIIGCPLGLFQQGGG